MSVSDAQRVTTDRSVRRYIIGSVVIGFLLAILSILTMPHRSSDDTAYVLGQFTGALIAPLLIAAVIYWLARWRTRGNSSRSIKIMFWGLAVWFIVLLGVFIAVITNPVYHSDTITSAEARGLTVSPDSMRHKEFGFAIPNPGASFVRDEETEAFLLKQFGRGSDMTVWFFRDSAQAMALAIQVVAFSSLDESRFRAFTRGMRPNGSFATVVTDTLTWSDTKHEYTLGLVHTNGNLSVTRCVPRLNRVKKLVICAQMVGPDPATLSMIPNGLTVND